MISVDRVHQVMNEFDVPGLAIGISHGDEEQIVGLGVTSLDNPLPVDGDTLFQIGSITKTYTATACMRLVDEGMLSLDAPVRTYLPGLRLADEVVASSVTPRHLLTHTGGWVGDYFASLSPGDDALAQMVARLDRLEQLVPLGRVWSYNNAGFYIAGRIIEVLTGKPFEAALRELVLDPLSLRRTFFSAHEIVTHRFAVGHHRNRAVARPWVIGRPVAPAGGLIASVRELLAYGRLQWEPNGVLSDTSLAEMRRPQCDIGRSMGDTMGIAWFLFEQGGHSFMTHHGATNGQQSLLVIAPEDRFTLAILTNHDNGSAVYRAVQKEVLIRALGVEAEMEPQLQLSPAALADYAGEYVSEQTAARLTVDHGRLVLELIPTGGFPEPNTPPPPRPTPDASCILRKGRDYRG